ncbi:YwiC-like family protein [Evansella halocellulosilytica]|uniref:YwiC-like family protein n=1 Tax=Evansella halocellulosilytica TaxID=2011013 RepID=UPI0015CCA1A8|nr:YwiC-like family protein [Evansella halocellulosilytica]
MKWYIPKEHGAWAMLIVPYWLGAAISGIGWIHLLFFIGVFSMYFAQAPLLTYIRNPKNSDVWPSFFVYVGIGAIFILPFLFFKWEIIYVGLIIMLLFVCNIFFAKTKRERLFINDFIAIVALSILLFVPYILNGNTLSGEALTYFMITVLFFTASVFHVKSLIREKKNKVFHRFSHGYHITIVIAAYVLNWYAAVTVFLICLCKTVLIPKKLLKRPIHIGIVEIANSVIFFTIIVFAYFM